MNKPAKILTIFLISFSLLACQLLFPEKTATPQPAVAEPPTTVAAEAATPTQAPSPAPKKATPTSKPTVGAEPKEPSALPDVGSDELPKGTPMASWKGIPVMPGAVAGVDDGDTYLFTTKASADEVRAYYEKELKKQGWSEFGLGDDSTPSVLLFFQKGDELITIGIVDSGDKSGLLQVVLVK